MIAKVSFLVTLVVVLPTFETNAQEATPVEPVLDSVMHGKYWRFFPESVTPESHVLVIAHGMFSEQFTAEAAAKEFLNVWIDFAKENGVALVAPVFSNEDFGCNTGCPHGWGYRGLYGRHVSADYFLHEVIAALQKINPQYDGKFYMFGHSAGGQFVSHYVVTHPQRVHTAAISAPAWLPFPTMDDNWPRGMKPRRSIRRWPGATIDQDILVTPNPKAFLAAAQLPLLVTAGELDTEPIRHAPSQGGDTHVARAQSWAQSMNRFAAQFRIRGQVKCSIVPEIAHSGGKMARSTMPFLSAHMKQNVKPTKRTRRKTPKKQAG